MDEPRCGAFGVLAVCAVGLQIATGMAGGGGGGDAEMTEAASASLESTGGPLPDVATCRCAAEAPRTCCKAMTIASSFLSRLVIGFLWVTMCCRNKP